MTLCCLASGSRGNALIVTGADGTTVLIDQGLSYKQLLLRMRAKRIEPAKVVALFLSHEHQDHVHGAEMWYRDARLHQANGRPVVYGTQPTLIAARLAGSDRTAMLPIQASVQIGEIELTHIPVVHNAEGAVTYNVLDHSTDTNALIIYETGRVTQEMWSRLPTADALLIEANHDRAMVVDNEKIPEFLMQRIYATHLSNIEAGAVIEKIPQRTRLVVLLHLSQDNNSPRLAAKVAREALDRAERPDVRLVVASQDEPTEVLEV